MPIVPKTNKHGQLTNAAGSTDTRAFGQVLRGLDRVRRRELRQPNAKDGIFGWRCINCDFQYSDAQLYNQLRYHSYPALTYSMGRRPRKPRLIRLRWAIISSNLAFLQSMSALVERYLDQSARRWVELGTIFSFMTVYVCFGSSQVGPGLADSLIPSS
ncbi:hypothetical protein C8J57DRAFT_88265 [Mycena rebaudengoi]|nr:hypothetical protein C8J57DRAFT_88265 [Mycena rebaudengoi]